MAKKLVQLMDGNDNIYPKETDWVSLNTYTFTEPRTESIDLTPYREIMVYVTGHDSYAGDCIFIPNSALPVRYSGWIQSTSSTSTYCAFVAMQISSSGIKIERLTLNNWASLFVRVYGKR